MKKTWTTRILIALMTLAMVIGVIAIAPQEAQAEVEQTTINGLDSGSSTIGVGQSIELSGNWSNPGGAVIKGTVTYEWHAYSGQVSIENPNKQRTKISVSAPGNYTVDCIAKDTDGYALAPATWDITVEAFSVSAVATTVGAQAVTPTASYGTIKSLSRTSGDDCVEIVSGTRVSGKTAGTATLTATSTTGATAVFDVTVSVGEQHITASASQSTAVASSSTKITLRATNDRSDGGAITWDSNGGGSIPAGGNVYTADPNDEGQTVTFTATAAEVSGKYAEAIATTTVNFTKPTTGLWANASKNGVSYGSAKITLNAGVNNVSSPDTDLLRWTLVEGSSAGTLDANTGSTVYFTPASSGTGAITAKIEVTYEDSNYETETKTLSITVSPTFDISPTSLSLRANNTSTQSFNVVTAAGAEVTALSSNSNVAEIVSITSVGNDAVHTVTVKPVAAGDATITVYYAGTTKTVKVHVASANPVISQVDFISCDWCTPNLNKVYNWGQLTITVKDYNPTNPYVTVTRSNIRTYIQGGSYYSHGSTYSYVATLTPTNNGLDGQAVLYVIPQYNGTTYYTASYTGATSKNSPTIYVTGHPALPQTGPNYTWAYVLGGLCLATVATAVTLNVRKKKYENI